jgi:hypothetical protein
MSKAHYIRPSGPSTDSEVVRLGATADAAGNYSYKEQGKLVKFSGTTDTYVLTVAGDPIEGRITSLESATSAGWTVGGINKRDKMTVIADGAQATPGTGTIAAGDFVVTGSVVAKDTAMTTYPKVCKATVQIGAVPADLTAAGAQIKAALNAWRVVSLGAAGTGAVGTEITIERVSTGL